ncbi:MAG: hypothetical protein ACYTXA_23280 [Nostoc sp.]
MPKSPKTRLTNQVIASLNSGVWRDRSRIPQVVEYFFIGKSLNQGISIDVTILSLANWYREDIVFYLMIF